MQAMIYVNSAFARGNFIEEAGTINLSKMEK